MRDRSNGLIKVGYSKDPKLRESTLQSEKPDIEMIFNIACDKSMERKLHKQYASKRVRGEWFRLSEIDIEIIKCALKKSLD
jgi:hypothetical protein